MIETVTILGQRKFSGTFTSPISKSHLMRALFLSLRANGTSTINTSTFNKSTTVKSINSEDNSQTALSGDSSHALSGDASNALRAIEKLGAKVQKTSTGFSITSTFANEALTNNAEASATLVASEKHCTLDVGNSGTALYFALAQAIHHNGAVTITGDEMTISRPVTGLTEALQSLGAKIVYKEKEDFPPLTIEGPLTKNSCSVEALTSQYLSALLLSLPFIKTSSANAEETIINVTHLNEKPYIDMTLDYLKKNGIVIHYTDYSRFSIPKNQVLQPFNMTIPGDYSQAASLFAAGAISEGSVTVKGLYEEDTQGDKRILEILKSMGAKVEKERAEDASTNFTIIGTEELKSVCIDLNENPDLLPVLAVLAARAKGVSRFYNIESARIKECDRIHCMKEELSKAGITCTEGKDFLEIEGIPKNVQINATVFDSHGDHRIAMAMGILALTLEGKSTILNSSAVQTSWKDFWNNF